MRHFGSFRLVAFRVAAGVVAVFLALIVTEPLVRAVDHYELFALKLHSTRSEPEPVYEGAADPARAHLSEIPLAAGVDPAWYDIDPPVAPKRKLTGALAEREARHPITDYPAYFEWNLAYLVRETCRGEPSDLFGDLRDFVYFEPTDGRPYPVYRHIRNIAPPSWFAANSFGWRGPDISLQRPANTIRIAFVGASTTIAPYSYPFSHPEFLGVWLNLWARARGLPYRFEVINAGRTGIDSRSIAAVVTSEVVPIDPDLVVYYEGSNQFWPGRNITYRFGRFFSKPTRTFRRRLLLEDYSALVRRGLRSFDRLRGGDGREPLKPPYSVEWPAKLDEQDPALDRADLPMDLTAIVSDLDTARQALVSSGGELAMTSFMWLVYDGMKLDLAKNLNLFIYLNQSYWPVTYGHMRRMADFQNRVFEKYARVHRLPFVNIAGDYPKEPALFDDAIHFTVPGVRLLGWLYLQKLIPLVEARIRSGQWPRPVHAQPDVHPAFAHARLGQITVDELKARCPAEARP
jgi:hypothetical protein